MREASALLREPPLALREVGDEVTFELRKGEGHRERSCPGRKRGRSLLQTVLSGRSRSVRRAAEIARGEMPRDKNVCGILAGCGRAVRLSPSSILQPGGDPVSSIDYPRFLRLVKRSQRLAAKPDVNNLVKVIFDAKFAAPAQRYTNAYAALVDMEAKQRKERREALGILEDIDQPYKEARHVVAAFVKDLAIPLTLKSISTATDKLTAIERLLEIVDAHAPEEGEEGEGAGEGDSAESWAQAVLASPFGQLAPVAIREISEWTDADDELEKAVRERAAAFTEAWPRFLEFRRQVRLSYGQNSIHHRRLVVRATGRLAIEKDEEDDDGVVLEERDTENESEN